MQRRFADVAQPRGDARPRRARPASAARAGAGCEVFVCGYDRRFESGVFGHRPAASSRRAQISAQCESRVSSTRRFARSSIRPFGSATGAMIFPMAPKFGEFVDEPRRAVVPPGSEQKHASKPDVGSCGALVAVQSRRPRDEACDGGFRASRSMTMRLSSAAGIALRPVDRETGGSRIRSHRQVVRPSPRQDRRRRLRIVEARQRIRARADRGADRRASRRRPRAEPRRICLHDRPVARRRGAVRYRAARRRHSAAASLPSARNATSSNAVVPSPSRHKHAIESERSGARDSAHPYAAPLQDAQRAE